MFRVVWAALFNLKDVVNVQGSIRGVMQSQAGGKLSEEYRRHNEIGRRQ